MRCPSRASATCALMLLAVTPAIAQPPRPVADLLQRPVGSATTALLVRHLGEPAAHARLVEALTHPQADVRTVAARIVAVTGDRASHGHVRAALAREDSAAAAAEQVRALFVLGDALDDVMREAAGRLGWGAARVLVEMIVRTGRGDLSGIPGLDEPPHQVEVVPYLAMAAPSHAELLGRINAAVAVRGPSVWVEHWTRLASFGLAPTDAERRMYRASGQGSPPSIPQVRAPQGGHRTRLLRLPASGLLEALRVVTGCAPTALPYAVATITYAPPGRPRQVSIEPDENTTGACGELLQAVYSLSVPAGPRAPGAAEQERVLVPWLPAVAPCADMTRGSATIEFVDGERGVVSPKIVREVQPVYSAEARRRRISGTVLLGATVTPAGCPTGLEVLRSLDPSLDLQALHAVGQWRFEPGTKAQTPVPVAVTVEVSFRLTR